MKKYSGEFEFLCETCATCYCYRETPGDEVFRKNLCLYWPPAATAQNQFAYIVHVQSIQFACAQWKRHPDLVEEKTNDQPAG